jgi:hypothetical protein
MDDRGSRACLVKTVETPFIVMWLAGTEALKWAVSLKPGEVLLISAS